jgi:hypothetical protein
LKIGFVDIVRIAGGMALIAGVAYFLIRWVKRREDHSNLVVQ